MTATTQQAAKNGALELRSGMLPQVNLLPPEVRAARGLTVTKRILGLALVGVLILCGVGYAVSLAVSASAAASLAQVQDEAALLKAEQAKYAEVPVVLANLKRTTDARTLGMSTDIQWKGYLDAISAVLPANVSIQTLTMAQQTPSAAAAPPADPLHQQGVAAIAFTGRVTALPDGAAWIDALNSVPTFYGATFTSETADEVDGVAGYTVTSSVLVKSSAFSQRFAAKTEGK